jgi:glycosyltransferase involved in cell wall biosynthesis
VTNDLSISVVMPVYIGTPPDQLRRALESVYAQTCLPCEVIVVEDGALHIGHYAVLEDFAGASPELRLLVLKRNRGRGFARQQGLLAARGDWVAQMDADDVCLPRRFEVEAALLRREQVDLVGGAMWEFAEDEEHPTAIRAMPTTHERIAAAMRVNNPINHPTVVFRREAALRVGGYRDMRMEDYDLWARMLMDGARMAGVDEPLVLFRADDQMFARRASWTLIRAEWRLQGNLRQYGVIGSVGVVRNLCLRVGFRLLPRRLLRRAYRVTLTRPIDVDAHG